MKAKQTTLARRRQILARIRAGHRVAQAMIQLPLAVALGSAHLQHIISQPIPRHPHLNSNGQRTQLAGQEAATMDLQAAIMDRRAAVFAAILDTCRATNQALEQISRAREYLQQETDHFNQKRIRGRRRVKNKKQPGFFQLHSYNSSINHQKQGLTS